MNQRNLLKQLNHEFPMDPAYLAFAPTPDGGARFTNPMEWRTTVAEFKVYADGQEFRVVVDGMELFPVIFNTSESLYNHIEKLSRLERRVTPEKRMKNQLAEIEAKIAKLQSQAADLRHELSFYN